MTTLLDSARSRARSAIAVALLTIAASTGCGDEPAESGAVAPTTSTTTSTTTAPTTTTTVPVVETLEYGQLSDWAGTIANEAADMLTLLDRSAITNRDCDTIEAAAREFPAQATLPPGLESACAALAETADAFEDVADACLISQSANIDALGPALDALEHGVDLLKALQP